MADLAYSFHWQPSELMVMDDRDLVEWHGQIGRINRLLQAEGAR